MKTSLAFALLVVSMAAAGIPARAGFAHFTSISPEGAHTSALVVDPSDPSTVYLATEAGIFKSTDAGDSWARAALSSDSAANRAAGPLVIDPLHPATLYAGSRSGEILKTVDGGATWEVLKGFLNFGLITALAIDPVSPDTVYATSDTSFQKSTDGGRSWDVRAKDLVTKGFNIFLTLIIDRLRPSRLYLGTQRGLYVSDDRGDHWSFILSGAGREVSHVAVDPNDSTRLYAADGDIVVTSGNSGNTWTGERVGNVSDLLVDGATSVVYVVADGKVFTSSNHGQTWTALSSNRSDLARLAFDGSSSRRLFAASGGDVLRSEDDGASWRSIHAGLNAADVTDLVVDPESPSNLLAATGAGLMKSTDAGAHWSESPLDFNAIGLAGDGRHPSPIIAFNEQRAARSGDAGATWTSISLKGARGVAIDPANPSVSYAALVDGVSSSNDSGRKWRSVYTQAESSYSYYGFEGASVAVDPVVSSNVYAVGGGSVIRSIDGGVTWKNVLSTGYEGHYFVKVLIDPTMPSTVYAASVNNIHRSDDSGATWHIGLIDGTFSLTNLGLDPRHASTLYLATGHGVRVSFDRGEHWESFDGGLPDTPVNTVTIDTLGNVYAATSGGLFVSRPDSVLSTATTYAISLRSDSGSFVSAGNCGGKEVNANGRVFGPCETFTLFDLNTGTLRDGDQIHLRAADGAFVVAEGGGGGGDAPVNANREVPAAWETFVIHKTSGAGAITSGDSISLQAFGGRYVAAEGGGATACNCDSRLNANRTAARSWETFVLTIH